MSISSAWQPRCRVARRCGRVLARSVRCISWLWHCLTPAAFECSFKVRLAECFPLRDLAPFSNPLLLLFFLRLCCCVFFLPFILYTSLCPLFCCVPRPLTAAVHLHVAEKPLTFDLNGEHSFRDQCSQWQQGENCQAELEFGLQGLKLLEF